MRSSLKDIAQALGISATTVSWVVAGKGKERGISEATQERVMKYAKELNYQPNLLARGLHNGESKTIGLLLPSIGDRFYSTIARIIELEVEKSGYTLMICSSESELDRENKMIDALRAKQVDGILMAPTKLSDLRVQGMINEKFPLVLFDRYYPELATNYVVIDNEMSSFKLVNHLIEKGYKKIAILSTNTHLHIMKLRHAGYYQALERAGIEVDNDLYGCVERDNYSYNVSQVLDEIFEKVPDVDAFFFTTHVLVTSFFEYMDDRKIDRDFGYASIHEERYTKLLTKKMNVATLPIESMGKESVRILMQDIKNNRNNKKKTELPKQGVVLSCNVIFRD